MPQACFSPQTPKGWLKFSSTKVHWADRRGERRVGKLGFVPGILYLNVVQPISDVSLGRVNAVIPGHD